ncbi:hypothetical protein PAPHI01_1092 [Pancytospora philotis]|nr:hypothetical protein PAPHI01_1092 [Pancytospora philotis]
MAAVAQLILALAPVVRAMRQAGPNMRKDRADGAEVEKWSDRYKYLLACKYPGMDDASVVKRYHLHFHFVQDVLGELKFNGGLLKARRESYDRRYLEVEQAMKQRGKWHEVEGTPEFDSALDAVVVRWLSKERWMAAKKGEAEERCDAETEECYDYLWPSELDNLQSQVAEWMIKSVRCESPDETKEWLAAGSKLNLQASYDWWEDPYNGESNLWRVKDDRRWREIVPKDESKSGRKIVNN